MSIQNESLIKEIKEKRILLHNVAQYKKKPVIIDAVQYRSNSDTDEVTKFTEGKFIRNPNGLPYVKTLEGNMTVNNGDYIIKGVKGEFYPCKPDIFEMTYEKVTD
jgi:hypothetical protein